MEQRNAELGTELVLDNRKLILGFVLLVALCGACFVIGFMEGKRQAIQAKVDAISPVPIAQIPGEAAAKIPEKRAEAAPAKDPTAREQLDWYKSVQQSAAETGKAGPKKETTSRSPGAPANSIVADQDRKGPSLVPDVPVPAARISYSVQVGAFRQLNEAEAKASAVKEKGFECMIDLPRPPNEFYLVKVGRYTSRVDALAMQRKLSKAGFTCFIKTN